MMIGYTLRSLLALILVLPVLAACGGETREERRAQEPGWSPYPTTVDCDEAMMPDRVASIGVPPDAPSREARATSWVAYASLAELAWASPVIVRGMVVADCPSGKPSNTFPPEHPDLVLVEAQAIYRGEPRTMITTAKNVDPWSMSEAMMLNVGDDVVLFLSPEAERGQTAWIMGGPQGFWRVRNDRVASVGGTFPALAVAEFPAALATAFANDAPPTTPRPIPLDQSPAGPDLPSVSASTGTPEASPAPAGCGGEIASTSGWVERIGQLAWVSQQVVTGTVIERRPSVRLNGPSPDADPALHPVVTDIVVEVEARFRGRARDTLVVRRLGGEVDGCVVTNTDGSTPEVGERLLLFLWSPEPDADGATFYVSNGAQGLWRLDESGRLTESRWSGSGSNRTLVPLADLATEIRLSLAGGPEPSGSGRRTIVPAEQAPIADASVPPLAPDPDWIERLFHAGGSLRHPASWTTFEGNDGALSLLSWAAGDPAETLPEGEMRIDLRELSERKIYEDDAALIHVAGLPGLISIDSAYDDTDPPPSGQVWWITVTWGDETNSWVARAAFSEPPGLDNPDTLTFFTILASITM